MIKNRVGNVSPDPTTNKGGKKPRPFACVHCPKSFAQSSNLTVHLRLHSGEKPYRCNYCEKRFSDLGNLTAHTRYHKDEKPYACQFEACGKQFVTTGDLSKHMRSHTGEKPFACALCEKRYASSSGLKYHVKNFAHPATVIAADEL